MISLESYSFCRYGLSLNKLVLVIFCLLEYITYIYIYIYIIYKHIYIYIYTNLPVNVIVRLPHPQSRNSQGQKRFLAPYADKQICNYVTECSNRHPSLSTLRSKGLSGSRMKW